MKKRNKDLPYFYNIRSLLIPKKVNYENMHKSINQYIDSVQTVRENIRHALEANKKSLLIRQIEDAMFLFSKVYARYLENEAGAILRRFRLGHPDEAVARITPFLTDMISLSIEMQRAQKSLETTQQSDVRPVSEIEEHADMVNNLTVVADMIGDGDFEKAEGMIVELDEHSPESMLEQLLDLVSSKQYEEAGKLASVLKEQHMDAIKEFAEVSDGLRKVVLAVDDRPELLSSVSAALKRHYKVFGLTSGEAALRFLQTKVPDIFVLDIEMPGMDGFALAQAIRGMEAFADTPIIFLTGNSSRESVQQAISVGGNDFIVKPANHNMLLAKIGKYLNPKS